MKLINYVLVLCVLTTGLLFGQSQTLTTPSVSPTSTSIVIDKAMPNTYVTTLNTKLSVVGESYFVYNVWVPDNYKRIVSSVIPLSGTVMQSSPQNVIVYVDGSGLSLGSYQIPVIFVGTTGGPLYQSVTFLVELNVIDSSLPQTTDPVTNDRVVPHIAVGNGWKTSVRLVNNSEIPSVYHVSFRSSLGEYKKFKVDGTLTYEATFYLGGFYNQDIMIESDTVESGLVIVKTLNGNVPGVTATYYQTTPVKESAVKILPTQSTNTLYFNNKGRRSFGLAIGNYSKSSTNVTMTFYSNTGIKLTSRTTSIPAFGNFVATLEDFVQETNDISGVVKIFSHSGESCLSVFGIQYDLNSGSFSTELGN